MISIRTIRDVVRQELGDLRDRVNNLVSRGVVKVLDDSAGLARGQSTTGADQVADDIEFVTPYGISARPAAGAETMVFAIGGWAGHLLAMFFDRRIRLKGELAEGEVALHIGVAGQMVRLKANGDVVVTAGEGASVYLGEDGATKKVALADDVDARFASIKTTFNAHVHPGVVAGPGSTAVTGTLIGVLAPTASDNVFAKG